MGISLRVSEGCELVASSRRAKTRQRVEQHLGVLERTSLLRRSQECVPNKGTHDAHQ